MRVRLPLMIQDPSTQTVAEKIERFDMTEEDETIFLDGPVSRRVAVLDFDETTGALHSGVRFQPPQPGRKIGSYVLEDPANYLARDFNAVSVFATVMKTLHMVEESDALGRRLEWGFDGPQLLVVPRAGLRASAFYERASHSLQFFFFPSRLPAHQGRTVFTSLSQQIVAHETGHAILDGIAPDLHHAQTPQALALHETIADLMALIMSFRSRKLTEAVLKKTKGEIDHPTAFSWLAEEFAQAKDRAIYLRAFNNQKTLDPDDHSRDAQGQRNRVRRTAPHLLCQVLTGALYPSMLTLFAHYRTRYQGEGKRPSSSVLGKALAVATNHFKRLTLRGLDYLPPGEVSFADYARALLASDQAPYPEDDPPIRQALVQELVRRHVVPDAQSLAVQTHYDHPVVQDLDLEQLVESDGYAYDFAHRARQFLGIPPNIHFTVRPRLDVTKDDYFSGTKVSHRECIFKVSWHQLEDIQLGRGLPKLRQITVGTTLALSWEQNKAPQVRALLRGDATNPGSGNAEGQRQDRNALLEHLIEENRIHWSHEEDHAAESRATTDHYGLRMEISGEILRLENIATFLHITGGRPESPADLAGTKSSAASPPRLVPPPGVDAGAFFNLVEQRRSR